jgi:hypothetical protein
MAAPFELGLMASYFWASREPANQPPWQRSPNKGVPSSAMIWFVLG